MATPTPTPTTEEMKTTEETAEARIKSFYEAVLIARVIIPPISRIKSFYEAVLIARVIIPPICGIGSKIEAAHKEGLETILDNDFKELLRECKKFVESFREDKEFLDDKTIKVFSAFIVYADAYFILNK